MSTSRKPLTPEEQKKLLREEIEYLGYLNAEFHIDDDCLKIIKKPNFVIPEELSEINNLLKTCYDYDPDNKNETPDWAYGSKLFLELKKRRKALLHEQAEIEKKKSSLEKLENFYHGLPSLTDIGNAFVDAGKTCFNGIKYFILNPLTVLQTVGEVSVELFKQLISSLDDILAGIKDKLTSLTQLAQNLIIGLATIIIMLLEMFEGFKDAWDEFQYLQQDNLDDDEYDAHLLGFITGLLRGVTATLALPGCVLVTTGVVSIPVGVTIATLACTFVEGYKLAKSRHELERAQEEAEKSSESMKASSNAAAAPAAKLAFGKAKKQNRIDKRNVLAKKSDVIADAFKFVGAGLFFLACCAGIGLYILGMSSPAAAVLVPLTIGLTAAGFAFGIIPNVFSYFDEKKDFSMLKSIEKFFSSEPAAPEENIVVIENKPLNEAVAENVVNPPPSESKPISTSSSTSSIMRSISSDSNATPVEKYPAQGTYAQSTSISSASLSLNETSIAASITPIEKSQYDHDDYAKEVIRNDNTSGNEMNTMSVGNTSEDEDEHIFRFDR